jgi:hypothetical protein
MTSKRSTMPRPRLSEAAKRANGSSKKMSPKMQLFVHEYATDMNAGAAAVRAGYSERTSRTMGPRLLQNVAIKAAIERAHAERIARIDLNGDTIARELWRKGIGPSDPVLPTPRDQIMALSKLLEMFMSHKTELQVTCGVGIFNANPTAADLADAERLYREQWGSPKSIETVVEPDPEKEVP